MKSKGMMVLICFTLLLMASTSVSAKRKSVINHDPTHDWVNIDTGEQIEGYKWLDILQSSIDQDGEYFVLSMNARGKIPSVHPDGINMAYWWGFDTDKDIETGWSRGILSGIGQDYSVQVKYYADEDIWKAKFFTYDTEGNIQSTSEFDDFSVKGNKVVVMIPYDYLETSSFYWRVNTYDYVPDYHIGGVDVAPNTGFYEFN